MTAQAEDWKALLAPWTAREIAALTGCPEVTAFQWKQGHRVPRPWVASLVLLVLRLRTECGEFQRHRPRPVQAAQTAASRPRA